MAGWLSVFEVGTIILARRKSAHVYVRCSICSLLSFVWYFSIRTKKPVKIYTLCSFGDNLNLLYNKIFEIKAIRFISVEVALQRCS